MVEQLVLPTTTLDSLLKTNGVAPANHDYWVVDLQGAEKLALSGATESLRSCYALVGETSTVEVYRNGVLWPELRDWLRDHGFVPLWQPELEHDDILFVRLSELARSRIFVSL